MMERKYKHLSSPIQIGNVTFKNRMFSAPMGGTDITADCTIGPKSTAFYELRAKGGAGAVTVSECMVHPETDGSHAYHLDLKIVDSLASFTYTADAIKRSKSYLLYIPKISYPVPHSAFCFDKVFNSNF